MLKRHVSDVSKPIYYLSGPADMIESMREILIKTGGMRIISEQKNFQDISRNMLE